MKLLMKSGCHLNQASTVQMIPKTIRRSTIPVNRQDVRVDGVVDRSTVGCCVIVISFFVISTCLLFYLLD